MFDKLAKSNKLNLIGALCSVITLSMSTLVAFLIYPEEPTIAVIILVLNVLSLIVYLSTALVKRATEKAYPQTKELP